MNELFQKKNIQLGRGVTEDMECLKKMWNLGLGISFPQVLDIGLGISKGCNTSFGNFRGDASFCLEFFGVK